MATQTRSYLAEVNGARRLVRASHPATVSAHIAKDIVSVRVATTDDVAELVAAGCAVESIKHEQQQLQTE